MMNPIIEFCASNLAMGSQIARAKLESDPDLDVVEYGCTGYCGVCSLDLFCLVDGEVVTGDTPDQLVTNVYEKIEEMAW